MASREEKSKKSGISTGAAVILVIITVAVTYAAVKINDNKYIDELNKLIPAQSAAPTHGTSSPSDEDLFAYARLDAILPTGAQPELMPFTSGEILVSFGNGINAELWYSATEVKEALKQEPTARRLRQLLGLQPNTDITTVRTAFVTSGVYRPAIKTDADGSALAGNAPKDEQETLFNRLSASYVCGEMIFTALGYTYDWANNGKTYGVSVFALSDNAVMQSVNETTLIQYLDGIKE